MGRFADGLKGTVCGIWESAPGRLIRGEPGDPFSNPATGAFYDMMNSYCADEPGFVPPQADVPFAGGQCPVLYNVGTTWTVTRNLTGQVFTASATSQFIGPIRVAGTQNVNGAIAGYINTGNGTVAATDQFDVEEWSDFSWGVTNVQRVDGQADNCGNPPIRFPGFPQPDDEDGIDITIPIEVSPNVTVDVEVDIVPDITNVNIPVLINNRVVAEINLGGVNFNVGAGGGGEPTDLSPVLDAIDDTRGDIEILRGDTIQGFGDTNQNIDGVESLVNALTDIANQTLQQVVRIGIPESIPLADSEEICETESVVPDSLFNAIFYVADQIRLLRQVECTNNVVSVFLGRYLSTLDERVRYFELPPGAKIIQIIIENVDIPQRISTYFVSAREGANGKFGFYNFAFDSGFNTFIDGTPGQIWTKTTYARVPDGDRPSAIRILAEPDLIVAVYDSGIR